jgi:uncharacterized membrane protein YdbT with pleckstrin-like domain
MTPSETNQNVEVARPIRRSVIILAVRIFLVLFVGDTIYAGLLLVSVLGYVPAEWTNSYAIFLWVVYTLKYLLLTYLIIRLVVDWLSTLYYVAGGHLVRQRGVLHTTESVFQLENIDSAVMSQSWLGRLLNFGDVTVEFTIARQKETVMLYAINDPRRYEDLFSKFV